ncbi:hypothetical protein B9Z55_021302 [Caenorhabditis nigoni]|uniref:Uncharacterized protein n=1 Tax=Caenorhabditis nigoni TaxID=1611254 RepID=A0A2G5TSA6_9PELO|nr:hypothetical protein B9Z55_021302 [Caenorhabditis nigoni]
MLELGPAIKTDNIVSDVSRRMFSSLAVYMALIRMLSITYPMNTAVEKWTKPRFIFLSTVTLTAFWALFYWWLVHMTRGNKMLEDTQMMEALFVKLKG